MSLTDPVTKQDEKDAIEAEHYLAAERDAHYCMEDYSIAVEIVVNKGAFWRGSLLDSEGVAIQRGMWRPVRLSAYVEACFFFDKMLGDKAKEIYEREYADGT